MAEREKAVFQVWIHGNLQAVWNEITKTHEPQGCFFNMRLHTTGLALGGQVQWRTASGKNVGVVGEVLEFDPPRRFAHTFRFTQLDDPPCKVIYDLAEKDGGVLFTMTLDDLPAGTKTAKQMKGGGTLITKSLKGLVEKGKQPFGIRFLFGIMRVLEPLTPKRCRVENWPLGETPRQSRAG
jgi:uncharacterized protein YndB with AHSA1/START domain